MRVVGYVRESPDPASARPAFSQQEELRRYADEHGHALVAICQDLRQAGRPSGRDGYLSLLGVVAAGGVDAVLVPGLETFSSDTIVQEVVLWDLASRSVRVISTRVGDVAALGGSAIPDPTRMLIRDVLERVDEHAAAVRPHQLDPVVVSPDGDVYVQLVAADATEGARSL